MGDVNKNNTFGKQKCSQIRNKINQAKLIKFIMSELVSESFSNSKIQSVFINKSSTEVNDCDVFIGNSKAFRSNKSIANEYILIPTEFENFQEMISSFFCNIFIDTKMDDRIKHICSIDDLILIVVTSKEKQVVGKRSTKLLQDSIIASAIFCSKPTYNYLILIGVSNQLHHGITYSENYGIGTFLLSTIDQIGKCMQSKFK